MHNTAIKFLRIRKYVTEAVHTGCDGGREYVRSDGINYPSVMYTFFLGIAGFLVSSNRVVTKLLIKSDRASTAIFFLTSTVYIAFSYVLHSITTHSPFVRYHMKACAKIVLRPDDDHTLVC